MAWGTATSFSQFGEDVVLDRLFERLATGFYVDVGAFHPYQFSNTYRLYRRGWRGINIEPDPDGYARLLRSRPRDVNLQVAVGPIVGRARFIREDLYSGIDDANHLWAHREDVERITVAVQPLAAILDRHLPTDHQVDLLDVDCEGHDLLALQSNNWDRYRPSAITIESHAREQAPVDRFLLEQGYVEFVRLFPTTVYVNPDDRRLAR